jgi:hypothetical protein
MEELTHERNTMLKFSAANAKIEALQDVESLKPYLEGKKVYSFDLLSGYSCPFANECLSKATVNSEGKRKIKDGPNTKFRCFSASQEVQYTNVYNLRKHNFDTLRVLDNTREMVKEILQAMPKNMGVCRIHVAGDFFNEEYLLAWAAIAKLHPEILFYAYTKSLRYWLANRDFLDHLPNFVLTASFGGRDDKMIGENDLRSATVVYSEEQADCMALDIDHDDSHAADPELKHQDFALLIHGTQPKATKAAEALKKLRKNGTKHSYSRKEKI